MPSHSDKGGVAELRKSGVETSDGQTEDAGAACLICNICDTPSTFEESNSVALVPSNVRKFSDHKFTVWRCNSCGSLHCKDAVDLDSYYADYPIHNIRLDVFASIVYANKLRRLAAQGLSKQHSILDYGVGNGLFLQFLRGKGYKNAVGYDPYSPDPRLRVEPAGLFDFVLCYDVLEHVEAPAALLRKLVGHLKDGGALAIGTPNADEIDLPGDLLSLHQPYHRHILTRSCLDALAAKAGLQEIAALPRYYWDTVLPLLNYRTMKEYARLSGDVVDVLCGEPINYGLFVRHPRLLFFGLFGYLFPPMSEMEVLFRQSSFLARTSTAKSA